MKKNEQIKITPVKTNLVKQNCYARVHSPNACDLKNTQVDKVYFELQRTPTKKGIGLKEDLVAVAYPITADYVASHLGSTNYKIDPLAAVARAPQRDNLGDIRNVVDILSMDTEEAVSAYRASLEHAKKVAEYVSQQKQKTEKKDGVTNE